MNETAPKAIRLGTREQLNALARDLATGKYRDVIVLSGAGVSTGSGIPDYRSGAGLFASVGREAFSDRATYREKRPELLKAFADKQPTASHQLATWLANRGWLRRVYTQNVDGLYQKAGLFQDFLLEVHGNLERDDVVLYGDQLPVAFKPLVAEDFALERECDGTRTADSQVPPDLVLVMGTSLAVAPFCGLPNLAPKFVKRTWITLHPARSRDFGPGDVAKFGKRKVSLRNTFGVRSPLTDLVLNVDCDEFSSLVINTNW
jgi:NAD+-dependent protein deacetylase SIR2